MEVPERHELALSSSVQTLLYLVPSKNLQAVAVQERYSTIPFHRSSHRVDVLDTSRAPHKNVLSSRPTCEPHYCHKVAEVWGGNYGYK